ncbi:protein Frey 1 [Phaethornis superciliosus]
MHREEYVDQAAQKYHHMYQEGVGSSIGETGVSYSVPEDFTAPLELPQKRFGLVDDYGIKPKQPGFRTQATREQLAGLRRAGKSKRDELDLLEFYDAHF